MFTGFGSLSARHRLQLRVLLLIGGIEPNPGPALKDIPKPILEKILTLLNDDDAEFVMPKTRADMLLALEQESPKALNLALRAVQQPQATPAALLPGTFADDTGKTIKLPDFYPKDTRIWFEQIEQMLAGTSESVHKNSLLRALPTDVIFQSGAKATDNFSTIKTCIIRYFDDTDDRRLRKLLEQQHLGDRKPSAALRDLIRFAPGNENLVKLRFLEILPESVRVVLASLDSLPLEKLADTADKMMEQLPSSPTSVCSLTAKDDKIEMLTQTVDVLATKLGELNAKIPIVKPGRSDDEAAFAGAGINAIHVAATKVGQFLADSGSDCSVLPLSYAQSNSMSECCLQRQNDVRLEAANGTLLESKGVRTLTFEIAQLGQEFTWPFVVANVSQPILGFDFLKGHGLAVDCVNDRLIHVDKVHTAVKPKLPTQALIQVCRKISSKDTSTSPVSSLRDKFKELFSTFSGHATAKHPVEHKIETYGQPCFARPRRLFGDKLQIAKDVFNKLERQGVIYRGNSPWATPLHMAPKPGRKDEWRPCGDYRQLNLQTLPDRYPMPNINDITNSFHGCSVFSKLDLVSAFHQIPVAPQDQPKTAITTPFGLFMFRRMPFGLRNASQTFQRLVDIALQDCPFAKAYIDDIIIGSKDSYTHHKHLDAVLQKLKDYGLRLRPEKCAFFQEKVNFVGIEISQSGLHPISAKIDAIASFPMPTTVRSLRRFLGMAGFYHRFVPHFSEIAAPLTDLTRISESKSKSELVWSEKGRKAFALLKKAIQNSVTLAFPDPDSKLEITTDASGVAVGAVLHQIESGNRSPLAFFSRKLCPSEAKKSAFDRELLAIYLSLKHFEWLLGLPIIIRTDHKPLLYCLTMKSPTAQQSRWLSYIAQFNCQIIHVSGSDNVVADALSRSIVAIKVTCDAALAKAQETDQDLQSFLRSTTLPIKQLKIENDVIACDATGAQLRPYLPIALRRNVFNSFHNLCHPGNKKTLALVSENYVWPGMNKDIKAWCRQCMACQSVKVGRHTKSPVGTIPTNGRFHTIHVDFVGPLPPSEGYRYLFTIVDRFTRWPEVIALKDMSTESAAEALLHGWISRFGVPQILISDRGSQFESALWSRLMDLLSIKRCRTTAYHPSCNGAIERFHRTLKASLRASCNCANWFQALPLVLLGLRSTICDNGFSPTQLTYGSSISLPGQFFVPSQKEESAPTLDFVDRLFARIRSYTSPIRNHKNNSYVPKDLDRCSHVWLRDLSPKSTLAPRYVGPFEVFDRDNKTVTISHHGYVEKVSIDRVKPAFGHFQESNNCCAEAVMNDFPVGAVVFAKFPGYPTWPAHIINADGTPLIRLKHSGEDFAVQFFSTDRLAYIPKSNIMPYDKEHFSGHPGVKRAMRLADEFLRTDADSVELSKIKVKKVQFKELPDIRYITE